MLNQFAAERAERGHLDGQQISVVDNPLRARRTLVWIGVQVAIIGYVSWMQPATAIGGLLILLLALGHQQDSPLPPDAAVGPPASSEW